MTFNPPDDDDGPRGYGKPPKANQFKPGQSGNPRGRPKKKPATTLHEAIAKGFQETLTVTIKGRSRKITQADYLAKKLFFKASSLDMKAMHILTQLAKGAPQPSPLPGLIGAADRLAQKFKLIQERRKSRGFDGRNGQPGRGTLSACDENVEVEKPGDSSGGNDRGKAATLQEGALDGSAKLQNLCESSDVGGTGTASESPQRIPPGERFDGE